MARQPKEDNVAISDDTGDVLSASLRALINPPPPGPGAAPREVLIAVSRAWADNRRAWQLVRRLVPAAEEYVAEIDRKMAASPGDDDLARLRSRARYAHVVAVSMYRQLRLRVDS